MPDSACHLAIVRYFSLLLSPRIQLAKLALYQLS